jgi:NAD(P)-dependent dehydrogenase (short-subunit alcohol dehydrogenase family)
MTRPRPARREDGICWITGASTGIGAALARRMAGEGWTVAISARSGDALEKLASEHPGRIIPMPVDITDHEAVESAISKLENDHGSIACAVLNAGIYIPVHAESPRYEDYARTIAVNLGGTAACLCALTPRMTGRGGGQIIIVSSATGFGGMPTASAYGATKAGLINMAECLAIELHRHGVLVQCVTPGFVETPAQTGNAFPKPFMISADEAARRIMKGMMSGRFEITFPRRFTWALKALYALPRAWHIALVRRQTGWSKPLDDQVSGN